MTRLRWGAERSPSFDLQHSLLFPPLPTPIPSSSPSKASSPFDAPTLLLPFKPPSFLSALRSTYLPLFPSNSLPLPLPPLPRSRTSDVPRHLLDLPLLDLSWIAQNFGQQFHDFRSLREYVRGILVDIFVFLKVGTFEKCASGILWSFCEAATGWEVKETPSIPLPTVTVRATKRPQTTKQISTLPLHRVVH